MTDKPSVDHLRVLMDEFTRSGLATMHVRLGDFELLLSTDANGLSITRGGQGAPVAPVPIAVAPGTVAAAAPAPAAQMTPAPASATPTSVPDNAIIISAPNLGTFYRAPKPGAAPYVELGGAVKADDEICLIEVMKLFTAVRAGRSGTIVAILAEDGTMVEAGQPLFALVAD